MIQKFSLHNLVSDFSPLSAMEFSNSIHNNISSHNDIHTKSTVNSNSNLTKELDDDTTVTTVEEKNLIRNNVSTDVINFVFVRSKQTSSIHIYFSLSFSIS